MTSLNQLITSMEEGKELLIVSKELEVLINRGEILRILPTKQ